MPQISVFVAWNRNTCIRINMNPVTQYWDELHKKRAIIYFRCCMPLGGTRDTDLKSKSSSIMKSIKQPWPNN